MRPSETPHLWDAGLGFLARKDREGITQGVMLHYQSILRRLAKFTGDPRVGNLTPAQVGDFFASLDVGDGAYEDYRRKVDLFFRWCRRMGYLRVAVDPMEDVPRRHYRPREARRLSAAELLTCQEAARHPRDRVLVAVAINTALRVNEILRLRVRDVDLPGQRLRVQVSKQRTARAPVDLMPITVDLDRELRRWLAVYEQECGPLDPDWYLVPGKGGDGYDRGRVNRPGPLKPTTPVNSPGIIARKIFGWAKVDVPAGEAWHVFRRSVARLYFDRLLDRGGYPYALKRTAALLHHRSMLTTERYLGLDVERQARDEDLAGGSLFA